MDNDMSNRKKPEMPLVPEEGEFLVYQAEDGQIKLEVRLEQETLWLTQQAIAELLQTTVPNISMHIKNIYDERELIPEATVKEFLIVHQETRAGPRVFQIGTEQEAMVCKGQNCR